MRGWQYRQSARFVDPLRHCRPNDLRPHPEVVLSVLVPLFFQVPALQSVPNDVSECMQVLRRVLQPYQNHK